MKLKGIITFSLLLTLGFSIFHSFVFVEFDTHKCSVNEYVSEFDAPIGLHDICDIHFEYHQAYIFPQDNFSLQNIDTISELILEHESYDFSTNLELVIPPIV